MLIALLFSIGPLRSIDDYQLHAVKHGYEFKQDTTKPFGQLHAFKLSQLTIEVADTVTQQPLSEVLISLSGGTNYRSNNQTDTDGRLTIIGLVCGLHLIAMNLNCVLLCVSRVLVNIFYVPFCKNIASILSQKR
jgi:hypothetical protein